MFRDAKDPYMEMKEPEKSRFHEDASFEPSPLLSPMDKRTEKANATVQCSHTSDISNSSKETKSKPAKGRLADDMDLMILMTERSGHSIEIVHASGINA